MRRLRHCEMRAPGHNPPVNSIFRGRPTILPFSRFNAIHVALGIYWFVQDLAGFPNSSLRFAGNSLAFLKFKLAVLAAQDFYVLAKVCFSASLSRIKFV